MPSARASALPPYRLAIEPARLESCIRRLDPADRALLDLSLNRGIPDAAMAPLLRTDPMRLAWKRARALERVASRLGVTHPADFAAVRMALTDLPSRAWMPLELQPAPVPRALEPPEPEGTEPRIIDARSAQALTVRQTAVGAREETAPARTVARPRGRALARRAAGAVLVGAAAALALRRR